MRWPTTSRRLHRLLLNKYYVDELYDATIVQPIKAASTEGLVALVRRARSSTARSTAPRRSWMAAPRAATSADRLGACLCRLAVRRGGRDPRLLPMAIDDTPNCQLSRSLRNCRQCHADTFLGVAAGRRHPAAARRQRRRATQRRSFAGWRSPCRWRPSASRSRSGSDSTPPRPSSSSSSARRGFRPSASTTTLASTASACCSSC